MNMLIIDQINLDAFNDAAQLNTLFGVLVSLILILGTVSVFLFKKYESMIIKFNKIQSEHFSKIEEIRREDLKKETIRNDRTRESEKETLTVLKGVNNVLELSEKFKENDTEKILTKLNSIEKSIENNKK